MKKVAFVSLVLCFVLPQVAAAGQESMSVGAVNLTLGMSQKTLESQLPAGWKLAWFRDSMPQPLEATKTEAGVRYQSRVMVDGKPVTINYDEEHGDHGHLANAAGEPVVMLVFERGKLTRATRIIASSVERSAADPTLATALATVLDAWKREQSQPVTVRTTHNEAPALLNEVVFESGARQLVILSTEAGTQIVENLGRGDVASVTVE